jgi:ubiquinone/menaquinone biosynthesis C-methylase UbiE
VAQGDEGPREPGPFDALIDYDRVADIYDLYVTSDLDIGFFVEEAGKVRGKVLELMCGTGRVSVPLLEAGVDLTCVDASEGMLARLEERLRARKLEARVLRADVRHLDLGEEEEFDLALIPFHSFSELVSPRD